MTASADLHGKTAISTGASRGIGFAAAQALATAGANVVLTSRKQDAADDAAAQITGETMVIDGGLRLGDPRPYRPGTMRDA